MEQLAAMEPTTPAMEEPPITGLTSLGGGAHDEGDLGDEGFWSTVVTLANPPGVGVGTVGDAPGSAAPDPPTSEVRLERAVRAQQQPRRASLRAATVEVEEIT